MWQIEFAPLLITNQPRALRLLDQLSGDSRYRKAQLDDPEFVARVLDVRDEELARVEDVADKKWRPAAVDWTRQDELLGQIRDLLGQAVPLLADLPTAPGLRRRHPAIPPLTRPETEFDRQLAARKASAEKRYDDRLDDLIGQAQKRWRASASDAEEATDDAVG